jgi:hypothetical protein
MKKNLTFILLLAGFSVYGQLLIRIDKTEPFKTLTFQNTLADKPNVQYIELSVFSQTLVNDIEICTGVLDIGELKTWLIADSSGNKPMRFNSPIDIFNYLSAQGWSFVNSIESTRTMALWAKTYFENTPTQNKIQVNYIFKRLK